MTDHGCDCRRPKTGDQLALEEGAACTTSAPARLLRVVLAIPLLYDLVSLATVTLAMIDEYGWDPVNALVDGVLATVIVAPIVLLLCDRPLRRAWMLAGIAGAALAAFGFAYWLMEFTANPGVLSAAPSDGLARGIYIALLATWMVERQRRDGDVASRGVDGA